MKDNKNKFGVLFISLVFILSFLIYCSKTLFLIIEKDNIIEVHCDVEYIKHGHDTVRNPAIDALERKDYKKVRITYEYDSKVYHKVLRLSKNDYFYRTGVISVKYPWIFWSTDLDSVDDYIKSHILSYLFMLGLIIFMIFIYNFDDKVRAKKVSSKSNYNH